MANANNWQDRYAEAVMAVGGVLLCVFLFLAQGGVLTWWLVAIGGFGLLLLAVGFSLKPEWRRLGKARKKSGNE